MRPFTCCSRLILTSFSSAFNSGSPATSEASIDLGNGAARLTRYLAGCHHAADANNRRWTAGRRAFQWIWFEPTARLKSGRYQHIFGKFIPSTFS